jgi:predicted transcriptional regulator
MKEKTLDERLSDLSLDDYCSDIMVILWKVREMRFNEIYRAMQNRGVKHSKPTLSEHLKHLRKRKWITRTARGVQNVTYSLHKDFNRKSDAESKKLLEEILSSVGITMIESSPDVKSELVLCDILTLRLEELRLRIEIEPNIQNHALSFGNSNCKIVENRLVNDCNKDELYRSLVNGKIAERLASLKEIREKALENWKTKP